MSIGILLNLTISNLLWKLASSSILRAFSVRNQLAHDNRGRWGFHFTIDTRKNMRRYLQGQDLSDLY